MLNFIHFFPWSILIRLTQHDIIKLQTMCLQLSAMYIQGSKSNKIHDY